MLLKKGEPVAATTFNFLDDLDLIYNDYLIEVV